MDGTGVEVGGHLSGVGFSSSTVWVLGIKPRSSNLAWSTWTHPAPLVGSKSLL